MRNPLVATLISFVFVSFAALSYAEASPIRPETLEQLKDLRTQIKKWAPMCNDGTLTYHECPFGDSLEYMGMLCLSGEERFCDQVKAAQDETGRWWRTPALVNKPLADNGATFSHDMARGA